MTYHFNKSAAGLTLSLLLGFFLYGLGLFFCSPALADDNRSVLAVGDFTVQISSITPTPVGSKCLLEVNGQLNFTGDIIGVATGTTRALVFATCNDVFTNDLGTFADVFRSELFFEGTVDGSPVEANMVYKGISEIGGDIKARLILSGDAEGELLVGAVVAQGGSYAGELEVEEEDDDD